MPQYEGRALGAFGALGGVMIVGRRRKVDEETENISFNLLKLKGQLEDYHVPMQVIKKIAKHDMEKHFITDTDPEGRPWTALDEDYKRWKGEHGGDPEDILTFTGDLESAATSEAAWDVYYGRDSAILAFDTEPLPDYWEAHQEGTEGGERTKLRKIVAAGGTAKQVRAQSIKAEEAGHTGEGKGMNIPPRPFIGLSIEAQEDMAAFIDVWVSGSVKFYVRADHIVQERISGSFGPKMFPSF